MHSGRQQHGKMLPLCILIHVLGKEAQLLKLYEEMLLQHHKLRVKKNLRVLKFLAVFVVG